MREPEGHGAYTNVRDYPFHVGSGHCQDLPSPYQAGTLPEKTPQKRPGVLKKKRLVRSKVYLQCLGMEVFQSRWHSPRFTDHAKLIPFWSSFSWALGTFSVLWTNKEVDWQCPLKTVITGLWMQPMRLGAFESPLGSLFWNLRILGVPCSLFFVLQPVQKCQSDSNHVVSEPLLLMAWLLPGHRNFEGSFRIPFGISWPHPLISQPCWGRR